MTRLLRLVVLGLAAAIAAVTAAAADWKQSPAVKELYEKAKAEGEVVIWGTNAREVDWIPAAFSAEWPGIKVNALGDNDIAPKIIAETRAGRHAVDVYWSSITGVAPIVQRELPTPMDWSVFGLAKDNTAFDGRPTFTRVDPATGAAYLLTNTDEGTSWTLNFKLERPFRNGIFASGSYLYNDTTAVNDGTSSTAASQFGNNPVPGNPNEPPVTLSKRKL